jgi:coproporphyrinogen III oxidase
MIGGYLEMIRAGIRERVVADRPADILDPQDSEHSLVFGSKFERDMQSYYHSLYIMQVLLLDRGTSVGLMAHKDNAVGVLKSLPSTFSLPAAAAIAGKFRGSLGGLADRVIRVLKSAKDPGRITDRDRRELASVVREYFLRRPGILGLQAPLFDPRS